ncbi:hypothetical protein [Flagellimonas sp.]|uniref:hypothetical protein n=1 Tax=Flagellimonas sp. TaxID=2058762 RepID=UPI003B51CA03
MNSLKKAYLDARQKIDWYANIESELDYLAEKVQLLQLTKEICGEKIREIGEG